MTPERWQRVTEVFEAAQAAAPGERPRVLARLCGHDPGLIAAVEALLTADADASGFLAESPALNVTGPGSADAGAEAIPQWPPGTLIAGRYRIERLVGRGGMGEVYAAWDQELATRVAIKVIRENLASDPRMLARFKREALTARQVSHPNICRVHDLVVHPGPPTVYCLSMELIEGDSLAAWLAVHGPPPPAVARDWLEAIAAALDAAHAAGVLHRDLKPANVLLRPAAAAELQPVLTDFGLARWLRTAAREFDASGTQAIGTLSYMAPEQWQGGELTAATDIFGFGLVALELLTGRRALAGPGPFGGWPQPVAGPAPSVTADGLDPAWTPFFAGTLAADPARRFPSAQAALRAAPDNAALRAAPDNAAFRAAPDNAQPHIAAGSALKFSPPLPRVRRPRRFFWVAVAGVALIVVSLFTVIFRRYWRMPSIPDGAEILLTPMVNASGDVQLGGVATMLDQQLAQSAHFEVMSLAAIRGELQRMGKPASYGPAALAQQPALAREVAMRAGAPLVVFAALTEVAGSYRLEVELDRVGNDPGAAARRWTTEQVADRKDDLFDAVHAAATWIRTTAGEAPEALAATDQPPQDVTTSSWTALEDYTGAEQLRAAGGTPQAIALLRQATRDDPHFALAYARLGDILVSQQRDAEGYQAYQQALRPADLNRLSRREHLRIEGDYDTDIGDNRGALQAFQAYAALYPNDYLGWFYQGIPNAQLGRPARAYAAWSHAEAVNPRQYFAAANRARLQLWQGQVAAAAASVTAARRLGAGPIADLLDAGIAFTRGNAALARQHLAAMSLSPDPHWASTAALLQASVDAEQGRYAQARLELSRGLVRDAAAASTADADDKHLALAYLALKSGDHATARSEGDVVLTHHPSPQQLVQLGAILAQSGDLDGAQRALGLLAPDHGQGPLAVICASRIRGEILLARHQPVAALRQFRAASSRAGALDLPEYLARGLAAAGQPQAALQIYDTWIASSGRIWSEAEFHLPGRYADMLWAAARLSDQLRAPDAAARYRRYLQLRRQADPGLPDVVYAQHRLQALNATRPQ